MTLTRMTPAELWDDLAAHRNVLGPMLKIAGRLYASAFSVPSVWLGDSTRGLETRRGQHGIVTVGWPTADDEAARVFGGYPR